MTAAEATDRAAPVFSARAVLLMLLVGVFAFAAFSVMSAYAPDLRSGRDGRGHALSKSAVGYAGVVQLAKAAKIPVIVSRAAMPSDGLLVLTPEPGVDREAIRAVLMKAGPSDILIILPKWRAGPVLQHPGWVSQQGLIDPDALAPLIPDGKPKVHRRTQTGPVTVRDMESSERAAVNIGPVSSLQTIYIPNWTPVFVAEDGRWLAARSVKNPGVIVVADPDLFNTQGMKTLARARLALLTFDDLRDGKGVRFDVTLNGFQRSRSVLKLLFEPPFLAATLCAVAAALLMGLHAASRFGPARASAPPLAPGKTALADNSAALLRLARREPAMAGPYADLTRQAVARAVGAPPHLDKADLDMVLDRLGAKTGQQGQATVLTQVADRVSTVAALLAVARKLYDYRRGMTRERN